MSNVKQIALGVLMYAQDYDETIPMADNNGSTIFGCCSTGNCYPDWGKAGTNSNKANAMFSGVAQPYILGSEILNPHTPSQSCFIERSSVQLPRLSLDSVYG